MRNFLNARGPQVLFIAVGIAYPFLVYGSLRYVSPAPAVFALLALLGLKFVLGRDGRSRPFASIPWLAAAAALPLVILSPLSGLRAYPIAVSLGFAAFFGHSLLRPPTIVERIARLREPNLPDSAVPYLRNVTVVWLLFFLVNAVVSGATALSGSLELWTLYNGLISYLFMGALFLGELIARWYLRRGKSKA